MYSEHAPTYRAALVTLAMIATVPASLAAVADEPPVNLRFAVGAPDSAQSSQLLLQLLGIRLLTQRNDAGNRENPPDHQAAVRRLAPETLAPHRPDQ